MKPEFQYNDGGRKTASKYKEGRNRDCVCRAISITTGLPYSLVHTELTERVRKFYINPKASADRGIPKQVWEPYLNKYGYLVTKPSRPMTISNTAFLTGTWILHVGHHLTAMIDGVNHDTWEQSGRRRIKHYILIKSVNQNSITMKATKATKAVTSKKKVSNKKTTTKKARKVVPINDNQIVSDVNSTGTSEQYMFWAYRHITGSVRVQPFTPSSMSEIEAAKASPFNDVVIEPFPAADESSAQAVAEQSILELMASNGAPDGKETAVIIEDTFVEPVTPEPPQMSERDTVCLNVDMKYHWDGREQESESVVRFDKGTGDEGKSLWLNFDTKSAEGFVPKAVGRYLTSVGFSFPAVRKSTVAETIARSTATDRPDTKTEPETPVQKESPAVSSAASAVGGFAVGDRVVYAKKYHGVVVGFSGTRVTVTFPGSKRPGSINPEKLSRDTEPVNSVEELTAAVS